jgi:hypothetical protein
MQSGCLFQEEWSKSNAGSSSLFGDIEWEAKNAALKKAFDAFTQSEKHQNWRKDYDNIKSEDEVSKNPTIAAALGAPKNC